MRFIKCADQKIMSLDDTNENEVLMDGSSSPCDEVMNFYGIIDLKGLSPQEDIYDTGAITKIKGSDCCLGGVQSNYFCAYYQIRFDKSMTTCSITPSIGDVYIFLNCTEVNNPFNVVGDIWYSILICYTNPNGSYAFNTYA